MNKPRRWPGVVVALVGTWCLLMPAAPAGSSPADTSLTRGGTERIRARQDTGKQAPPLELLHSGRVETRGRGSERITDVFDSVLFRQGDQYVLADRANFVDQQEMVTFWGNVRGWDPVWRFRADRVVYQGTDRLLTATGEVQALREEDGTRLECAELRYDRAAGEGVATGSPYLYQPPADSGAVTEVIGRAPARLSFQRDAGWAEIEGGATVRRGEVEVRGLWLRTESNGRVLTVRDSVRFSREGIWATGHDLHWDEDAGQARLKGAPPVLNRIAAREEGSEDSVFVTMVADSIDMALRDDVLETILLHGKGWVNIRTIPAPGSTRLTADSTYVPAQPELMALAGTDITITLEEEQLKGLKANRAAMYYWREDVPERQSAMGGIDLEVQFEEGEPRIVTAEGNATARFFQDADDEDSGVQRALAGLIRLTLRDGDLEVAHLENGTAKQYTMDMFMLGRVPMAVHPDSIQVGAGSRPTRQTGPPPPRQPPPRGEGEQRR